MKPERLNDKKKPTRNDVRTSLRSSNGPSSSSETSPNIASRPKRTVNKRSLDASDFLTSHEEERQLAKALKESLKELKKNNDPVPSKSQNVSKNHVTDAQAKSFAKPSKEIPTSKPSKETFTKAPKDPPPPSQSAPARPKRDAAQRASVITDLLCLKSKEERELRKAIELSKKSVVEDKRKREETSSIMSPSSPVTDLSVAASTSSASNTNHVPHRRQEDAKSQVSDTSSMDEMILKKPKIPPQRKFAQNSVPPNCINHSTMCTPIKHSSTQSYVHNPHNKSVPSKEVFSAITPSTEDFLTFLCLRNAPALPQKVDLISMNEKAIQEKRINSPKPGTATAKSPSASRTDGPKMNGSAISIKNVDSRRSSATSSSLSSNPFQRSIPPPRKSNIKLAIKSESHLIRDRPVKRVKAADVTAKKVKTKCSSNLNHKTSVKKNLKVDLTPTKRVTRSASSTSHAESTSSAPVVSVEEELKAQQEKRLKEQMIAIEKQHQVRRRFSSDSSLHSSDSSSSESLPSTSSSASINISRVTRSIETLKQLRVIGQQSKLKSTNSVPSSRRIARGQVASKAILQKAKRNLNSKSCSNGKLSKITR